MGRSVMCGWVWSFCGELNKKMGVVDLRIWRGKCNSPQVKIFPGGVAGVGGVCGKGKVAGVVVLWCL